MGASTSQAAPVEPTDAPNDSEVPLLENGDRLTRDEFERRYEAMPELKKAELIDGVVYIGSPVRHRYHGWQHAHLICWLCTYEASTPGLEVGDNCTVRLNVDNIPQPDCLLLIRPENGGGSRTSEKGYIEGAPNWSRRLLPAARVTTLAPNSRLTCVMAYESTSSGASPSIKSTGSCDTRVDMNFSKPQTTDSCAVSHFPAFGSIPLP